MDLFDFFFPEEAQAAHLRRLADGQRAAGATAASQRADLDALERENRELRMYLTALIQTLVDKGLVKPDEIRQKLTALMPPTTPNRPPDDNPLADLHIRT